MELHSYAKRRASKKWTIEQKRKLVEARISNDALFTNEPRTSVLPWKKILILTKLDDYNVFFVRKQWSSMVARYKQYKQNRLGNIPTKSIDDEMIQKITKEWEFFEPIHHYMTRKTTNLHSYALKRQAEPTEKQQSETASDNVMHKTEPQIGQQQVAHQQSSTSSTERIFSSDTNEDFVPKLAKEQQTSTPTDHDLYTLHSHTKTEEGERGIYNVRRSNGEIPPLNYFADASEDTQESMVIDTVQTVCVVPNGITTIKEEIVDPTYPPMVQIPLKTETRRDSTPYNKPEQVNQTEGRRHLSERDKYYRHKRRFNRRLERRFDSLLNVFGQVLHAEYPNIDVSPLLGDSATIAAAGSNFVNRLFSSNDDETCDSAESPEEARI